MAWAGSLVTKAASSADFDWDAIFEGVDWFHFTGITPALGPNVVEICKEACKAAKARNVKISCDLNYRGKLWTREQARAAMTELCRYAGVHAVAAQGVDSGLADGVGGQLGHKGRVQAVVCQGDGHVGLAAAEGELQMVGLHKALVVIGLEPDHQPRMCAGVYWYSF